MARDHSSALASRPIFIDKDLCFLLLTGSPQSKNFTNTISEVFLMLSGMTEGANRGRFDDSR
jgi:hypothetical protein